MQLTFHSGAMAAEDKTAGAATPAGENGIAMPNSLKLRLPRTSPPFQLLVSILLLILLNPQHQHPPPKDHLTHAPPRLRRTL